MLRNPRFPEAELPRVIANFVRNLAVARTRPAGARRRGARRGCVYGDHPFGRTLSRTDEQLAGYTIDGVRGFHAQNFGAARTHVYVAGVFDRAAIESAIREAFGDWAAGAPATVPAAAPRGDTLQLTLIDAPGAPQSSMRIAVPVPRPASTATTSRLTVTEQPARRHLQLAHHEQHPRGQGLHAIRPVPRSARGAAVPCG